MTKTLATQTHCFHAYRIRIIAKYLFAIIVIAVITILDCIIRLIFPHEYKRAVEGRDKQEGLSINCCYYYNDKKIKEKTCVIFEYLYCCIPHLLEFNKNMKIKENAVVFFFICISIKIHTQENNHRYICCVCVF